jgi:hypothetical protein
MAALLHRLNVTASPERKQASTPACADAFWTYPMATNNGQKTLQIRGKGRSYYQMGILRYKSHNYLVYMKPSTRKTYAHRLDSEGSGSVINALREFAKLNPMVITSGQDPEFLTRQVLRMFHMNNLLLIATGDNGSPVL